MYKLPAARLSKFETDFPVDVEVSENGSLLFVASEELAKAIFTLVEFLADEFDTSHESVVEDLEVEYGQAREGWVDSNVFFDEESEDGEDEEVETDEYGEVLTEGEEDDDDDF